MEILKWILAFILPPVAVFLDNGKKWNIIISILLTIIVWLPGIIYAVLFRLGKIKVQ